MKRLQSLVYSFIFALMGIFQAKSQNTLFPKSTIYSNEQIQRLVEYRKNWADSIGTQSGFRVQVFSSSGPNSKTQALEERAKFLVTYPEKNAYLISQMPYFKVRVGDFRERMDALKFFAEIKPLYPNAFIVPDEITIK